MPKTSSTPAAASARATASPPSSRPQRGQREHLEAGGRGEQRRDPLGSYGGETSTQSKPRKSMPVRARGTTAPARCSARPPRACPCRANAGSTKSMSNERNAGASPTRPAHARRRRRSPAARARPRDRVVAELRLRALVRLAVERPAHAGRTERARVHQPLLHRPLEHGAVEVLHAVVATPRRPSARRGARAPAVRAPRRRRAARRARSSGRRRRASGITPASCTGRRNASIRSSVSMWKPGTVGASP